ncbi:glycosyltransferase family 4 protein [Luteolibacter yonseiensis]|uniref:Glycosyltransferase family 4 protein n=1 Tax=Luteolibacter yonseiensis TaxID=1144680 RepID=A0A934R714_9BACT|nr:glycosyltransferase family 4 protein [Luteolibacter yonseiensis]MBK1817138.1 glycosyltransferase family 4 protein [Luteolibacter yonseiensis]
MLRGCSPAISDAVKRELPDGDHDLVSYVPNPVPFDVVDTGVGKEKVILFVGRLHPEKGVGVLIDAFRILVQEGNVGWKLIVVGPSATKDGGGGEEFGSALVKSAEGLDVEFTGPVFDDRLLKDYFARASIFCYPAQEGSGDAAPVAPREAMAYGAVPVVSQLPCFGDVIHHDVNGICYDHLAKDQPGVLSGWLKSLMTDPELLERLSGTARRVVDDYSSQSVAVKFLEDFHRLKQR